jgi:hypothetical protein
MFFVPFRKDIQQNIFSNIGQKMLREYAHMKYLSAADLGEKTRTNGVLLIARLS